MPEQSETPAAAPNEKAASGTSKIPLILSALNTVLLAGVLVVTLRGPGALAKPATAAGAASAEEAKAEETSAPEGEDKEGGKAEGAGKTGGTGPTVRLPDFIVHLRDPDADRYARLSFEVELKEEKAKDVLNGRLPQIRDSFLAYLSDRSVEELRGSEAMALLKEALTKRLREIAPGAPVKALYVTDLVVQ
jgi:flagellar FliL protein